MAASPASPAGCLWGGGCRLAQTQPRPLRGTACLQKQSLPEPLVSLRPDSTSLLFKEARCCHQGLYLITETSKGAGAFLGIFSRAPSGGK